MAQSVALAVLENLVHMSRQDYPTGYVVVAATVPDHVRIIGHHRYPEAKCPDFARARAAGDHWLQSGESAVLRVPSAVVAGDWNYLINPQHLDFAQISIEPPKAFQFDERLFEGK
jgi:RES domain-containing protein